MLFLLDVEDSELRLFSEVPFPSYSLPSNDYSHYYSSFLAGTQPNDDSKEFVALWQVRIRGTADTHRLHRAHHRRLSVPWGPRPTTPRCFSDTLLAHLHPSSLLASKTQKTAKSHREQLVP
ncbi:hypothetical protein L596_005852 [Steinernema carpocapsae]|uniref:Uncharacterized protein n=1 Tax=Steinernema carpocapsae TaxID=34508 RepID=A0A4U8V1L3_STECR|nr:hypothetical protein L596_005852 [Steinernema carpocapsae]